MRFLELELEDAGDLGGLDPAPAGWLAACTPSDDDLWILDRPDGARTRLIRYRAGSPPVEIPIETPDFTPRLIADDGEGRILLAGAGRPHNAVLFNSEGREVRRYDLGPEIADLAFDPDGNIVVLRASRKGRRGLLDRYGIEGDRVVRDGQLETIAGHSEQLRGSMVLVQRDGTLWLNLAEKYTADGELLDAIDPAEVFGPGRVSADLLGWDGLLVLTSKGRLAALLPRGERRTVKLPAALVEAKLGRGLTAESDLVVTRGERGWILATDLNRRLSFRLLWE